MNGIVQFVLQHGYSILFAALLAHQLGLPLPGPLFLLAAGALAAAGKLGLVASLGLGILACVLADWVWYEAGRSRGDKILHFIHRLTPDPDFHDRRAKETFARCGLALLVVAKFVPGLDAVTPPLAGTSRTSRVRFFVFDAIGATLYSGAYAGLGYIFSQDLERVAAYAGRLGTVLASVVFAAAVIYLLRNPAWRRRLVGDLRRGSALLKAAIAEAKEEIASAFATKCPPILLPWPTSYMTLDEGRRLIDIVSCVNPGNTGTYEGGNLLVGRMLGSPTAAGLTLALRRRARALFWAGVGAAHLTMWPLSMIGDLHIPPCGPNQAYIFDGIDRE